MKVKIFILIIILIRLFTQMQTASDGLYFVGRDILECGLIYVMAMDSEGIFRRFMFFMFGLAFWNLIEPLFIDPTEFHLSEYYYFIAGFILMLIEPIIFKYVKHRIKRH